MGARQAIAAGVMLAAGLLHAQEGAAQAQGGSVPRGPFDGAWAIDVRTAVGPCGSGFGGEYSIVGGRISGRFTAAGGSREVTGTVDPDGTFRMEIGGPDGIVLTGRLQWRLGWGEWESAGCAGTFITNRR